MALERAYLLQPTEPDAVVKFSSSAFVSRVYLGSEGASVHSKQSAPERDSPGASVHASNAQSSVVNAEDASSPDLIRDVASTKVFQRGFTGETLIIHYKFNSIWIGLPLQR